MASKISENTRKKGGNPHFRFYDVTSGDVNRSLPVTSHPVAMSVMRNGTLYTTTIVRKKRGKNPGDGQNIFPVTSLPVTHA